MLPVCTLLVLYFLGVLGSPNKKGRDSSNEPALSDLQLLLPIKYEGPPKSKDVYPKSQSPGRLGLLPDGPYSRLPASDFFLDEALLPPTDSHKKVTKKDLSRVNLFDVKRSVYTSDLAGSCLKYLFKRNSELSRSGKARKRSVHEMERQLLGALCKKYLEYDESFKENRPQNGEAESSVEPGEDREDGNMASGAVAGFMSSLHDYKNGEADSRAVSGFPHNGRNVEADNLRGYSGNVGFNLYITQTGKAGNERGSLSPNSSIVHLAGNAAFDGIGGMGKNVGLIGPLDNLLPLLDVVEKGGVSGNLGIRGQRDVDVGTAGNQNGDIHPDRLINILEFLLTGSTNKVQRYQENPKLDSRNNDGLKSNRCLFGSLAYGQGSSPDRASALPRDEHCPHCLHVFHEQARAHGGEETGKNPGTTPAPMTLPTEPSEAAEGPLVASSKFRPPGGRRTWMVINDAANNPRIGK